MKYFTKADNLFASFMLLFFVFLFPPLAQVKEWIDFLPGIGGYLSVDLVTVVTQTLWPLPPLLALFGLIVAALGRKAKGLYLAAAIAQLVLFAYVVVYQLMFTSNSLLVIPWFRWLIAANALALLLASLGVLRFTRN